MGIHPSFWVFLIATMSLQGTVSTQLLLKIGHYNYSIFAIPRLKDWIVELDSGFESCIN